jgi:hypothetical protein
VKQANCKIEDLTNAELENFLFNCKIYHSCQIKIAGAFGARKKGCRDKQNKAQEL